MSRFFFDPETHRYYLDGVEVGGVTQIVRDEGFSADFSMVDPAAMRKGAARGTAVHAACDLLDEGDLDPGWRAEHPELEPYLMAWEGFSRTVKWKPEMSEVSVWSTEYRYCGRLDRIGMALGQRWLLDIKTGQQVDPGVAVQVRLYHHALMAGVKVPDDDFAIDRLGVVLLRPDGTYKLYDIEREWPAVTPAFALAAVSHWWWRKEHGRI